MVKSMDLAWVVVSDMEAARKFFSEKVGLKELEYHEEFSWAEYAGEDGGTRLGVAGGGPEMEPGSNAIVTLTVEDIEKARADLEAKGVTLHGDVVEVPGHVKLQLFADSDGNKFQLVEKLA